MATLYRRGHSFFLYSTKLHSSLHIYTGVTRIRSSNLLLRPPPISIKPLYSPNFLILHRHRLRCVAESSNNHHHNHHHDHDHGHNHHHHHHLTKLNTFSFCALLIYVYFLHQILYGDLEVSQLLCITMKSF